MHLPETPVVEHGSVTARDSTSIGYMKLGTGAPLVVCHGAFTIAADWLAFAAQMAATHTIYLYDRRGRAASPYIGPDFALDAELGDLAAMIALTGPETAILGHSFGGACALAFAARHRFTGKLIVYEPPHSALSPVSRGHTPEIERLIAAGALDGATRFAIANVVGMPEAAVEAFAQTPLWPGMCETVTCFPKELRLLDSLNWQPGDLDAIGGQTFLLLGTLSPSGPEASQAVIALQTILPALQTVAIPGQAHVAHLAAPALLAQIVTQCLAQ